MRRANSLWEATMPSPGDPNPEHRGIDWAAIFRTLLVQVVVLLALAGAFGIVRRLLEEIVAWPMAVCLALQR